MGKHSLNEPWRVFKKDKRLRLFERGTVMSGSKKSEYWSGIIKEWESSSQTQVVFCKEREISHHAFSYSRTRLNRENVMGVTASFLKVLPRSTSEKVIGQDEGLTIWVKDKIRLIIKTPIDTGLAASLIKALEE